MRADVAGGVNGFVSEDGHEDFGTCCADHFEGLEDAGVDVGMVEFVDSIVVKEECESFSYILLVG